MGLRNRQSVSVTQISSSLTLLRRLDCLFLKPIAETHCLFLSTSYKTDLIFIFFIFFLMRIARSLLSDRRKKQFRKRTFIDVTPVTRVNTIRGKSPALYLGGYVLVLLNHMVLYLLYHPISSPMILYRLVLSHMVLYHFVCSCMLPYRPVSSHIIPYHLILSRMEPGS